MTIELVSLDEVNNFIVSLKLPSDLAKFILKSVEDCKEFMAGFHQTNARLTDDLLDYREHKIAVSEMTVDGFLSACRVNGRLSKEAFENAFLEDFCDEDMKRIENAIVNHAITLQQLFENFLKNPNKRIMLYI